MFFVGALRLCKFRRGAHNIISSQLSAITIIYTDILIQIINFISINIQILISLVL